MEIQQIKPFNELSEFQQQIITFLTAANPDVEVAKMLFLGYLREQRNDPDYLYAIEWCSEDKANKGDSIHGSFARAAYNELKQEEQKFINDIFQGGGNFSEFSKKAAALVDSNGSNYPNFFPTPIWHGGNWGDGNYYRDLNLLMNLYQYPINAMKNNPVLVKFEMGYNVVDRQSAFVLLLKCMDIVTKEYPKTAFCFNGSIDWIKELIKYRFYEPFMAKELPVLNLIVDYRELKALSNILYSFFDYYPAGVYLIDDKLYHKKVYNGIKNCNIGFWRLNFIFEKNRYTLLSDNEYKKYINDEMQKLAQDLHFDHYQITHQILM